MPRVDQPAILRRLRTIICDNASTDATEKVARDWPVGLTCTLQAGRIRRRRERELQSCFQRDERSPCYLGRERRPLDAFYFETVSPISTHIATMRCAYQGVRFIDESGVTHGLIDQPGAQLTGSGRTAFRPIWTVARGTWSMELPDARHSANEPVLPRFGSDVVLMWEMLLRFSIGTLGEPLVEYRRYEVKDAEVVWRGIQPEGAGAVPSWLHVGLFKDLLDRCNSPDLDVGTRAAARRTVLRWLTSWPFRDLLVDDLRNELRRADRHRNALSDSALLAAMAVIRPSRALRNARRSSIFQILRHGGDPAGPPPE